jgi:hypothetical protein
LNLLRRQFLGKQLFEVETLHSGRKYGIGGEAGFFTRVKPEKLRRSLLPTSAGQGWHLPTQIDQS